MYLRKDAHFCKLPILPQLVWGDCTLSWRSSLLRLWGEDKHFLTRGKRVSRIPSEMAQHPDQQDSHKDNLVSNNSRWPGYVKKEYEPRLDLTMAMQYLNRYIMTGDCTVCLSSFHCSPMWQADKSCLSALLFQAVSNDCTFF